MTLRVGSYASVWLPALLFGVLVFAHRWVCDDGFIYFHVADNLLSGMGPVFNAGERVEVYTSPIWLALLTFAGAILRPFSSDHLPPFEWIAVVAGVVCSIAGYVAATLGSNRLLHAAGRGVPAGAFLVFGVVSFWDFGTSGLESSLVCAWLGLSFAALVRARDNQGHPLAALCFGLGPLVRPDLAIFSILYGLVLWQFSDGMRHRLTLLGLAILAPAAYEVFRMGYFACLIPNTAIAKEATLSAWPRGWLYLTDFQNTYQLWIPLLALAAASGYLAKRFQKAGDRRSLGIVLVVSLAGLLHGTYVTRVGGDFLHARMLLPAVFSLALPTFVLPPTSALRLSPLMATWALLAIVFARVPIDPNHIGVERGRLDYIQMSGMEHPVTTLDHGQMHWESSLEMLQKVASQQPVPGSGFYSASSSHPLRPAVFQPWLGGNVQVVAYEGAIGMFGYEARDRIYICDHYGLADPFVARAELLQSSNTGRGKAGHEKGLKEEWCQARTLASLEGHSFITASEAFAIDALKCGELAELQAALIAPLSVRRFMKNLVLAAPLTSLRIPADALRARQRYCDPAS